jgi:nitrate reductase gamma subunit
MIMTALLFLICYLAAVVFVVACLVRIAIYARAPIHLRWELYPVPHEDPARVAYGGSRFEEVVSPCATKPFMVVTGCQ